MALQAGVTAFQPDAFHLDAFQILDDSLSDGFVPPANYSKRHRKSQFERSQRKLEQALEKAFEPKRPVKRDIEPWLAEIIEPPSPIPEPEFNPQIAGLSDYVAQLQAQLAQRKFELSQMEADDELLLLSL